MEKYERDTKRSLIASIMSLVLCVVMLMGTTLAWFTDSVSSGVNKIQAGNLDVELFHKSSSSGTEQKVDNTTKLFLDTNGNEILWEPGVVTWETFKVKNVGTLALKYQLAMNLGGNNWVKDEETETNRSLKDVIDVYIFDEDKSTDFSNRENTLNAIQNLDHNTLSDFVEAGNLLPVGEGNTSEKSYTVVLYWDPSDSTRDNLYNLKNGLTASDAANGETGKLYIDLGVKLNATQYTKENDSFGDGYDKDADGVNDYTGSAITASATKTAKTTQPTTFKISAVPATESDTKMTEVTFEADALDNNGTYTLEATTNDVILANANYTVEDDAGVVGAIDLTLTDNSGSKVETFNGKTVTITTYVAKNLSNVSVVGPAEADVTNISYEPSTGKLKFTTNHFSTYIVSAAAEAYIVEKNSIYETITGAVEAADGGATVTLLKDITLDSTVTINKNVSINLNDKTLSGNGTRALHITGGAVALTGSGLVTVSYGINEASSVIRVGDNNGEERNVSLTIGKGIEVQSDYSYGVTVFGSKTKETLTVDGKVMTKDVPAISGNGSSGNGDTTINVNGWVATENENAIYHPQSGTLNINGTVSGGIELKSGIANIVDTAVITANGNPGHSADNNGCSTQGYAIAVVNNTSYAGNTVVKINGGTINGEITVVDDNEVSDDKKGKFEITGGTFSIDPSTYVSNGYEVISVNGKFEVKKIETWSDHAADSIPYDENENVYIISTPEQLAKFAHMVNEEKNENDKGNTFSGKTVKLANDIDLGAYVWIPVGQTGATQFMGTFDGDNHTIKNLRIKNQDEGGNCSTGLFGWLNTATVKNLTVDVADISGHHNVGVIAGYMETSGCKIENCHVKNANVSCTSVNKDANGDKCGGIVGHAGNAGVSVTNCKVSNSTISAGRDAGQVVGAALEVNVTGCSAENVNVSVNGTSTGANIRDEVIGRIL